jgi:hypothetical protein
VRSGWLGLAWLQCRLKSQRRKNKNFGLFFPASAASLEADPEFAESRLLPTFFFGVAPQLGRRKRRKIEEKNPGGAAAGRKF